MRILLASSEVHPYSKTGGLADSVGAFAKALAKAGHEVGVVTPLHRGVRERYPELSPTACQFDLPLGSTRCQAGLLVTEPTKRLRVYFVDKPEFFDRAGIYGQNGLDYPDNADRFVFFCKCIVELARKLDWKPEIIHVHDWHTGLVPLMISQQREAAEWNDAPAVCLTIHNLAYQGVFPRSAFALTNLPEDFFGPETTEFYGQMNCLKAGISSADAITTVSPRYAREITTPELGCGLDGLLRKRQNALLGILNGVDYDEWKTVGNPFLAQSYGPNDLGGKAACKAALQAEFQLPVSSKVPLFGVVTRLAEQKGIDIALGALEEMLSSPMQFIMLGSGAPGYEQAFQNLASCFPGKMGVRIGYDHSLAHRIESGCDFYLMPSRFEPCGLNQMYSLRYGTIPVVRRTGGLDDTVVDILDDLKTADGIKFTEYSAQALSKAIRKAQALFANKELTRDYRLNGMRMNFSWQSSVRRFEECYDSIIH
jgi:starch synthase